MVQKKGDIVAMVIFLALMLVIAISFLLFTYIFHTTATIFHGTILNNVPETRTTIDAMDGFGTRTLQELFLFVFGGFLIAMMISSFFIDTHPVFVVVYIMLMVINLFIAIFVSNAYQTMNVGELAATYASQSITKAIMENIVRITLAAQALSIILLFAKAVFMRGSSGGGGNL